MKKLSQKPGDVLQIELPLVVACDDYHEIHALADTLNALGSSRSKVKAEELGFDGRYLGLLYLRKDAEYRAARKEWVEQIRQFDEA